MSDTSDFFQGIIAPYFFYYFTCNPTTSSEHGGERGSGGVTVRESMREKEQGGGIKPFKYYTKQTIKTDNKKTVVIHEKKVK